MEAPQFLTVDDVLGIQREAIERFGGSHGLRDRGLLESAVHAPAATFGGQLLNSDVFEIAAGYLVSILLNHPFIDGNKRAAVGSEPELSDLAIKVATGDSHKADVAEFFRRKRDVLPDVNA
jgi:hypothetical protein